MLRKYPESYSIIVENTDPRELIVSDEAISLLVDELEAAAGQTLFGQSENTNTTRSENEYQTQQTV